MTLVYHGTPVLYPEHANGSGGSSCSYIAAIRFPTPVRLKSIRVTPEGVEHPTGVGYTALSDFTAEILLNIAPSDPVNALARTTIRVSPATHAIDYALDMPDDSSTRLVVIRAPVQQITLSLYAYDEDAEVVGQLEEVEPALSSGIMELPLPSAKEIVGVLPRLHELDDLTKARVLDTLAVLSRREVILGHILDNSRAAEALISSGAERTVASILGLEEPSYPQEFLAALFSMDKPWSLPFPSTTSSFSSTLALARAQRDSLHPQAAACLCIILERLDSIRDISHARQQPTNSLLARILPPLAVHAMTRGSTPSITLTPESLPPLQAALAEVTATGLSVAPAARRLIAEIAPTPSPRSSDTPSLRIEGVPLLEPPSLLSRALDSSSSVKLNLTAAELLSTLAPGLFSSLGTASHPPLGVPPTPNFASRGASDYGGKVYSAHEFRRERDTTSGLGVGVNSVGRKASRHVDEFARA